MKTKIFLIAGLSLAMASCSDWLDVNETPNNATAETVSAELLLTSVENDIAGDRAGHFNSTGSAVNTISFYNWAQMFTKSGDYSGNYPYLNGSVMNGTFNSHWQYRYARIALLRKLAEKAEASNTLGLKGIAQVLMCIEFRELVDIFGDVPFSEGGLGQENLTPSYEKGEDIYRELFNLIREAENNLETGTMGNISNADIYFHGDRNEWVRYAKSIELSMLMRVSNVALFNEVNGSARLKELEGNCLTESATSNPGYYVGNEKMNPQYFLWGHTYTWNGNYIGKRTGNRSSFRSQYDPTEELVKFMRDTKNPLLRVYVDPREKNADQPAYAKPSEFGAGGLWYIGIPYGIQTPMQRAYVSLAGIGACGNGSWNFSDDASKDLVMYPVCIVKFYFAEAALRGLIPGGDEKAKAYYTEGIKDMMEQHEKALQATIPYSGAMDPIPGTAAEAAEEFANQDGEYAFLVNWDLMTTDEQKLEAICTQKWLGYYMLDPLEAWSEIRRTDYPSWLHCSYQWTLSEDKMPARCLYPATEKALNEENFKANEKKDIMNDLIFWDTKNPVRKRPGDYLNSKFVNGYEK